MSDDKKFDREAGRLWNAGTDALDAEIRSKLNQRRQVALDTLARPARRFNYWMPAAGVAAAVAVSWMWLGYAPVAEPPGFVESETPDTEIIFAETSLDVLEELEFYAWLDEEDADAT